MVVGDSEALGASANLGMRPTECVQQRGRSGVPQQLLFAKQSSRCQNRLCCVGDEGDMLIAWLRWGHRDCPCLLLSFSGGEEGPGAGECFHPVRNRMTWSVRRQPTTYQVSTQIQRGERKRIYKTNFFLS